MERSSNVSAIKRLPFSEYFMVFGRIFFILVLLGPIALPNFRNIWLGYPPVGDLTTQFWPMKLVAMNAINTGQAPLWNPYQFSGVPLLADPQNSLLYPTQLLFGLLPVSKAFAISLYIHIVIASLGTLLLMRRYVDWLPAAAGTLAFTLGGTVIIRHLNLPVLQTLSLIPWIFLCLELYWQDRHFFWWIAVGVLLALQILAGFPTFFFYTLLAICFYVAYHFIIAINHREGKLIIKLTLSFFFAIVIASMLSAAQWMPTLEFMSLSSRVSPDYSFVKLNSLPIINLATTVMPEIFGSELTGTAIQKAYWAEHFLYIGVLPIILSTLFVVCSKENKLSNSNIYLILAIIFLVLSFGANNPIYKLLYNYVPGFKQVADPGRMVIFYSLFLSIVSAISIQFFSKWLPSAPLRFQTDLKWSVFIILGIFVTALLVLTFGKNLITTIAEPMILERYGQDAGAKMQELDVLYKTQSLSIFNFLWVSVASYLLITQRIRSKLSASTFISLCFLIIIFDVGFLALRMTKVVHINQKDVVLSNAAYTPSYVSMVRTNVTNARLLPLNSMGFNNQGSQYGIPAITGYNPLILSSYMEILGLIRGYPLDPADRVPMITAYDSTLLKMLNVGYLLSDEPLHDTNLELIDKGDGYLYKNSYPNSYAYMIYQAEYYDNSDQILARMSEPSFDPLRTVLFEHKFQQQNPASEAVQKSPESTVLVTASSLNNITLDVYTSSPGWLVLSEIYYPGWKAYVDGRATEIQQANHILRSVEIDPGRHSVIIYYDPDSVNRGVLLSLLGAFFTTCILFILLIKRYNNFLRSYLMKTLERIKLLG